VKVRDALGHGAPRCAAPVGRFHSSVRVEVGVSSLRLHNGVYTHRVRWDEGPLVCETERTAVFKSEVANPPWNHPPAPVKDKTRFVKHSYGQLAAAVDLFGQVALLGYDGRLVCMFFSFRHELAVWTPDGACLGPERLLSVPPTPAAAGKIATALRAACELAPGRVPE
jgi:MoxR-vWA-beta-propeller ternary system domain bpX1